MENEKPEVQENEKYQTMPPLTEEEYADLKKSIEENGVLVPVEIDEDGNCIDGHHRLQICRELGIEKYPTHIQAGMSETEKMTASRAMNVMRRQLTREQRQKILEDQLVETPEKSNRQIADQLGVDHKTVGAARAKMESSGELPQMEKTVGADGRSRTARPKAKSKPAASKNKQKDPVPKNEKDPAPVSKSKRTSKAAPIPPDPDDPYGVEDYSGDLLSDVKQLDGNIDLHIHAHSEMLKRADGRTAVIKALDEVQKILEKYKSIIKNYEEGENDE